MDDFDELDLDFEEEILDVEKIKNNIPNYNSQKLCEIIVCNRYFNIHNDITVLCMEELIIRRTNGDNYKFEEFIEKSSKELPEIKFNFMDIKSIIEAFKK